MKKFVFGLMAYFAVCAAHWWFSGFISVFEVKLDIVFMSCLAVAMVSGPFSAFSWCFFAGLYADILGSGSLGAYALVYTLICYGVFFMRKHFDFNSFIPQIVLTFAFSIVYFILYQILSAIFIGVEPMKLRELFISPVLNAIVLPTVFSLFYPIMKRLAVI